MKVPQFVLFLVVMVAVVAINNVFLLSYMGYFSSDTEPKRAEVTNPIAPDGQKSIQHSPRQPAEQQKAETPFLQDQLEPEAQEIPGSLQSFQEFVRSPDFTEVLDKYMLDAGPRYQEKEKRFNQMDATELYSIVLEAENNMDKQIATQLLMRGKVNDLERTQLKTLYQQGDLESWWSTRLLATLLEDGDDDALVWAKQFLDNEDDTVYFSSDVYESIYHRDPEYIKQHLSDIDINTDGRITYILGFLASETELAKEFYSHHFDDILESDRNQIYRMMKSNIELDLSQSQQSDVINLFDSQNRHKRSFAIDQVGNIDDINGLRGAYQALTRPSEQKKFLKNLMGDKQSSDKNELAKELASGSDDPEITELFKN